MIAKFLGNRNLSHPSMAWTVDFSAEGSLGGEHGSQGSDVRPVGV